MLSASLRQLCSSFLAGLLHHTVCFTSLDNTLAVLRGYMRLLQLWQQHRAPARGFWRTAESFGDFKDHVFSLSNGSTMVMRGRCLPRVQCHSDNV